MIIWLTGLSGSGKSTIAEKLHKSFKHSVLLDGDNLRNIYPTGFTSEDRYEHIIRAGKLAKLISDSGNMVICSFISPSLNARMAVADICKDNKFVLVYIACDIKVCISRDTKGLYDKAIKGEIKFFTGISQKYDEPNSDEYDVLIRTDIEDADICVRKIYDYIQYRCNDE